MPENTHRARKMPTPAFPRRRSNLSHARRHRSRSPHHPPQVILLRLHLRLRLTVPVQFSRFSLLLAFLPLVRPKHRPERHRLPPFLRHAAANGISVSGKPRPEKRNRDGSRPSERRLAFDEVRHAADRAYRGFASAAEGGEDREGRGGGGGRRRCRYGWAALTGAHGSAVWAEGAQAVLEAGWADSGPPTLRRVFWTFPYFFFVRVECHDGAERSPQSC